MPSNHAYKRHALKEMLTQTMQQEKLCLGEWEKPEMNWQWQKSRFISTGIEFH